MTFRAYMIKIQFASRPVYISKHNDSLLFMVLYREALDRLCVRLNMYLVESLTVTPNIVLHQQMHF